MDLNSIAYLFAATQSKSTNNSGSSPLSLILFLVVIAAIAYLLFIRPRQRQMAQNAMRASYEVGDEIMLTSGIIGIIDHMSDDRVWLEISPGVTIEVLSQAIAKKIEPVDERDEVNDLGDESNAEGEKPSGEVADSNEKKNRDGEKSG